LDESIRIIKQAVVPPDFFVGYVTAVLRHSKSIQHSNGNDQHVNYCWMGLMLEGAG
jgi:hypothetical protein